MWIVTPGKFVGPFALGEVPEKYSDILSEEFSVFKRFPDSDEIYAYDNDGVYLTVDSERKIIQIAVFPPNEVYLGEIQLLKRELQELIIELSAANVGFESIDSGLQSDELGIVLVEVDGRIDSVELVP
ncbi:hypothetical protein [uncultured Gimesia sp.]|uniref:hypothetical protein n=1 Tax=uncultured Gimesia sp. TaxID=1678688 RepID=UPI0026103E72|nr:hypothetical protein [uncultured Gimesia sp.]